MGTVESIHIASEAGKPMAALETARVLAGKGIAGDRYANRIGHYSHYATPGRHVTMIEVEVIESIARAQGIPFAPHDSRRNITTRGIRLNPLVGKKVRIGSVLLEVVRLCEPCIYLQQLLNQPVLYPLVHQAGIRCDVVTSGTISSGDALTILA